MGIEENKEIIRQICRLNNQGDFDAYFELYSPDFVAHTGDGEMSFTQTKWFDEVVQSAFSDIRITIDNMIGEGDKVAFQQVAEMTHTGIFLGAEPTGKRLKVRATYIVRIVDNKIMEWWGNNEFPLLMQQLGITPPGQK